MLPTNPSSLSRQTQKQWFPSCDHMGRVEEYKKRGRRVSREQDPKADSDKLTEHRENSKRIKIKIKFSMILQIGRAHV